MFERSAELYDAVYDFKDYAAESRTLHEMIGRHVRTGARTLLDVACGTGQHLALLRAWYEVEGVELDPGMLGVARRRLHGVPLVQGDMLDVRLGRRFDAVTCLFSSIGYVATVSRMRRAVRNLRRHVAPGGVLIVEPWFTPDKYSAGHIAGRFVDRPKLKIARVTVGEQEGMLSIMDMHYLVASPAGVERFVERHELGLFTHEEYLAAFRDSGLDVHYDPDGLMGRGLYIGVAISVAEGGVAVWEVSDAATPPDAPR